MKPLIITPYNAVIKNNGKFPLFNILANKMRQQIMEAEDQMIFDILDNIAKSGNI